MKTLVALVLYFLSYQFSVVQQPAGAFITVCSRAARRARSPR